MAIFGPKNTQFWIFPRVPLLTHARRHLGEDFRKFSAKTNDKNWSYQSKTFKNWIFGKNGDFFTLFGQKNTQFWIFPRVPRLKHASRHLGEDFRKFTAKTNDKNWSYQSKTLKKLDFWPFFDTSWPKNPQFWIFPRVPLLTHANRHLGENFRKFSAKSNDKI